MTLCKHRKELGEKSVNKIKRECMECKEGYYLESKECK